VVIGVGEGPAAANRDQTRVTNLRKDHGPHSFPHHTRKQQALDNACRRTRVSSLRRTDRTPGPQTCRAGR
jgi:hypothetical protein